MDYKILKKQLSFDEFMNAVADIHDYMNINKDNNMYLKDVYLPIIFAKYYTDIFTDEKGKDKFKNFEEMYELSLKVDIDEIKDKKLVNVYQWKTIENTIDRIYAFQEKYDGDTLTSLVAKAKDLLDVLETMAQNIDLSGLINAFSNGDGKIDIKGIIDVMNSLNNEGEISPKKEEN